LVGVVVDGGKVELIARLIEMQGDAERAVLREALKYRSRRFEGASRQETNSNPRPK
jgi:hypothetical protein